MLCFGQKYMVNSGEKGLSINPGGKGFPLKTLFDYTGLFPSAREAVFIGSDFGERKDIKETFYFARSLPIDKALHPDTIIAFELNGKPIPFEHGYPLRLITPQWYAMASVKWLKKIVVIDGTFNGPFQSIDYVYYPKENNDIGSYPVTKMNVNSTIRQPIDHSIVKQGSQIIQGIAWSGHGTVQKVELSFDQGRSWKPASFGHRCSSPYEWVDWSYHWVADHKGKYSIWSRATDSTGRIQPLKAIWNRKGYGYNAVCKVDVKVE